MYEPRLEGRVFTVQGREWDSRAAILLIDSAQRQRFSRAVTMEALARKIPVPDLAMDDCYAQAALAESLVLGRSPKQGIDYLLESRSRNFGDFSSLLSPNTITARLIYEGMRNGVFPRLTVGFAGDSFAIDHVTRATDAFASARELYWHKYPQSCVELFDMGPPRPYEPCSRFNGRLYPVSITGWVMPREEIVETAKAVASQVLEWDDARYRRSDCAIDARNEMIVAEGLVRGYSRDQIVDLVRSDRQDASNRRYNDTIDPAQLDPIWVRTLAQEFDAERFLILTSAETITNGREILDRSFALGKPLSDVRAEIAQIIEPVPPEYVTAVAELVAAKDIDVKSYGEVVRMSFTSGLSPQGAAETVLGEVPVLRDVAKEPIVAVRQSDNALRHDVGHSR